GYVDQPGNNLVSLNAFKKYQCEPDDLDADLSSLWKFVAWTKARHRTCIPNGRDHERAARIAGCAVLVKILSRPFVLIGRRVSNEIPHSLFRRTDHVSSLDGV